MAEIERQSMQVDIACVGFGPATAGFLKTLSENLINKDGTPKLESKSMPGMPLQVICYERADDLGFGVSGVVTRARAIKNSFPSLDVKTIPMATEIKKEKLVYLLDPIGASKRSTAHKWGDKIIKTFSWLPNFKNNALELAYIPSFLKKHNGLVLSIGQFNQWIGSQLMESGAVQLWPGTPVSEPLFENHKVKGVRLMDQGTDKKGKPDTGFLPGMDIHADLTVVGDGPVGAIGKKLDEKFGLPNDNEQKDWAVGMKMVIQLDESVELEPGTVFHTFGFPEPEIFGFMYVHPDHVASVGIFIPSSFDNPVRTSYRYLQHWMMHPYIWRYLKGGTLKSWGAKTLQESGKRGEPFLVGDGYARIGEGSASTNMLTSSGVDEAWMTGVLLAEAVNELAEEKKPFTRENLERTYLYKRRESWLEKELKQAERARDGFQNGFFTGLFGMALTGFTKGKLNLSAKIKATFERIPSLQAYYKDKLSDSDIQRIRKQSLEKNVAMSDAILTHVGWPEISYDGQLLMSHQDALLMGGKVQAPPGYKDHVIFIYPHLCETCESKICVELCSGQAITPGENGVPVFEREKCVHCGACLWNCTVLADKDKKKTNIDFTAGPGGLHSAEN